MKVECVFCGELKNKVNECGVCEDCWCPEGDLQWSESKEAKKEMMEI